jgi:hypothetical protein
MYRRDRNESFVLRALEKELEIFRTSPKHEPTKLQLLHLERNSSLLKGPRLQTGKSRASQDRAISAKNVIQKLYSDLDLDLFILCTLRFSTTELSSFMLDWVPGLKTFWNSVEKPQRFRDVVTKLCEDFDLDHAPDEISCDVELATETSAGIYRQQDIGSNILDEASHNPLRTLDVLLNIHTSEQRVFENATIQGISETFERSICESIRLRAFESELRAAVTMIFPVLGGPVDCLMSLDIHEKDVARLAMTLFGTEVRWVDQALHVVLNSGFTMIIPNSEITLKGVADETILEVFGGKTHDAMIATPIRRREVREGKRVTECVSMIITRTGAIISLCLGMKGGVEIQNKLYT